MRTAYRHSATFTSAAPHAGDAGGTLPSPRPSPIRWERVPSTRTGEAGFTMVEIALSLGIIAFALVAIIGVMPSGMKVQRENREDTIVNQDASYLLEAIRSGSK